MSIRRRLASSPHRRTSPPSRLRTALLAAAGTLALCAGMLFGASGVAQAPT